MIILLLWRESGTACSLSVASNGPDNHPVRKPLLGAGEMRGLSAVAVVAALILAGCSQQPTTNPATFVPTTSGITSTSSPKTSPTPTTAGPASTASPEAPPIPSLTATTSIAVTSGPASTTSPEPSPTPSPTPAPSLKPTPVPTQAPTPDAKPPAKGDWIITQEQTVEDATLVLNGNLIVKRGAKLTLRKVTLTVNTTHDGQYGISVEAGGSIFIDHSAITSINPQPRWSSVPVEHREAGNTWTSWEYRPTGASEPQSPRFSFVVRGESFEMRDSRLQGCGWGEPYASDPKSLNKGLFLEKVSHIVVEGNMFSNNFVALTLRGGNSPSILNNAFSSNDDSAFYLLETKAGTIAGNTFSSNLFGMTVEASTDNAITGNTFAQHRESAVWLFLGSQRNVMSGNTISSPVGAAWAGIAIGNVATHVVNSNTVVGNTISGGWHGIAIYHSSNNSVKGNSIVDSLSGIALGYSDENDIVDNDLSYGPEPLISTSSGLVPQFVRQSAVELFHSSGNTVANNSISSAREYGIVLSDSSSNNTLQGNVVWGCELGIGVFNGSDGNNMAKNSVVLSAGSGITLKNSKGNAIHSNNFVANAGVAHDDGGNSWNSDKEGNYWSDYGGRDANGDGVGEAPQRIPPYGADARPMVRPFPLTRVSVPERKSVAITPPALTSQGQVITGDVVWQDKTVTFAKATPALIIGKGGTLTLKNATLVLPKGFEGIYVQPGGTLNVLNSKIVPAESAGGFLFQVQNDATLVMKGSELHGAGFAPHSYDWGGLYILSTKVTIEDSLISDSYYGIVLGLSVAALKNTTLSIRNNTVSDCYGGFWGVPAFVEGYVENNRVVNTVR